MKIYLTNIEENEASQIPSNVAVGSARSCYSGRLITPEDVSNWKDENETSWDKKERLLKELFESGHHTTMQHSTMTFQISGISRLLIWRLLHSHAHYNSDQMSQRYAKVKPTEESYYYPDSINPALTHNLFEKSYSTYEKLTEILTKDFEKSTNKVEAKNAKKKAMELARYVLPQATTAHLYHSINLITALRYIKAASILPEAETEAKELAENLKIQIIQWDPQYATLIDVLDKMKVSFPEIDLDKFPKIHKGKKSAVFNIIHGYGYSSTSNIASPIAISSLFHPMESMGGFSVKMKISLSADAQNQRHRMSPGLRPDLIKYYKEHYLEKGWKDFSDIFFIPEKIIANQEAFDMYVEFLEYNRLLINKLFNMEGVNEKDIPYFFPNALLIEIVERNDFSNFAHKAKLRTCLNAQEEIRLITEEIIEDLDKHHVEEVSEFVPPCVSRNRAGINPACSEGVRFCGVKVWKDPKYKILEAQ